MNYIFKPYCDSEDMTVLILGSENSGYLITDAGFSISKSVRDEGAVLCVSIKPFSLTVT